MTDKKKSPSNLIPLESIAGVVHSDDLMGIQHKDIARIKLAFQVNLKVLAKKVGLKNLGRKVFTDNSIFDPADMHFFFNERKELNNGYFTVMIRINDKIGNDPRTYYAVFSLEKDMYKGFPVHVYTEEEYRKFEDKFSSLSLNESTLPARNDSDESDIERYISNNEKVLDRFIRERIHAGDFAEIAGRAEELGWDEKYPDRIVPATYWPRAYIDYTELRITPLLKAFSTNVEKAFRGKNLVFLKLPKGGLPEIEEDGKVIIVGSHMSANAVYFFIEEPFFGVLDQNFKQKQALSSFNPKKDPRHFDPNEVESILQGLILRLLHEIGVSYGFPYVVMEHPVQEVGKTKKRHTDFAGILNNNLLQAFGSLDLNIAQETILKRYPELENLSGDPVDLNSIKGRDYAAPNSNRVSFEELSRVDKTTEVSRQLAQVRKSTEIDEEIAVNIKKASVVVMDSVEKLKVGKRARQ